MEGKKHELLTISAVVMGLVAVFLLIYVMYDLYVDQAGTAGKVGNTTPPQVKAPQPLGFVKGVSPAEAPLN